MSALRFVTLEPEMLDWLQPVPEFATEAARQLDAQKALCGEPNFALALLEGGYMRAAAGVVQIHPGRGYAWMLPGADLEKRHYGRILARCHAELARLAAQGMTRVECAVRSGRRPHVNFVIRLGFDFEARMRAWGPDGADYDLCARVVRTAFAGEGVT